MQPGALTYLAECFEARAPGFAAKLRDWHLTIEHEPIEVAREAIRTLAGAQALAVHCPLDRTHREVTEAIEVVFHDACRRVFARDAQARRTLEMTTKREVVAALRDLSHMLDSEVETLDACRRAVALAFFDAETPSQEKDVIDACDALGECIARVAQVYEAAAVAIEAAGGSVVVFNDVPITAACVRLEARVAVPMSDDWSERAEMWREVADEVERRLDEETSDA